MTDRIHPRAQFTEVKWQEWLKTAQTPNYQPPQFKSD